MPTHRFPSLQSSPQAIEEKEQILHKLLDTVKGYSAMKADFEKLLEAIGGLETERHELEVELERAKRAAENGSKQDGVASTVAVERIKERFHKVKKELEQMREERKNKENAYRLMQVYTLTFMPNPYPTPTPSHNPNPTPNYYPIPTPTPTPPPPCYNHRSANPSNVTRCPRSSQS